MKVGSVSRMKMDVVQILSKWIIYEKTPNCDVNELFE